MAQINNVPDLLNSGEFNTVEVRPWDKPTHENQKEKNFVGKHWSTPLTVHGFNYLDINCGFNIRVDSQILNPTQEKFTASIKSWGDTQLYSVGFNWLEIPDIFQQIPYLPLIQTGIFDTEEKRDWTKPQLKNSKSVTFAKPYHAPPKVVCFLRYLDLEKGKNWRIKTYASEVTTTGFTINIDSWSDTVMYRATASWIAYPQDAHGLDSGRFSAVDIRPWQNPQHDNSKAVTFTKSFSKAPKMFIALDEFDYDAAKNLRLKTSVSDVSQDGFTWHLQSWGDSIMYNAAASYLAWE
ncbi:hypothetical protein AbraIFM66951_000480 [Aspergillus brasiliensis]|uniref:H-type lectin domain-containing protein n=1 Tax=Aspergillus brasiliensis TaxID=319629 RepID=A0A9W5YYS1_9EURO|nr:hypothetical protein AbraCBS73388_011999 [Aspergillus brasiliensis]GKZ48419.1 hypothetical protein AbraIFM66951_000480 [Aspergillus brasiliensis]